MDVKSIIVFEKPELVEEHECEINHCFQEVNRPADKLARMSRNFESIHVFNSHDNLPSQVRGLVNMFGMPNSTRKFFHIFNDQWSFWGKKK
ncbi:hypothetical protein MTR67_038001 [Solanum verrucosum]|uniref:RNase H type-1 domain-containing protein n=1 Tax=Solanum verrucosum TaxID=315347 RepID=A0AAF0UFD6_SOLVR|nr:hypothetical protein MTR67_038001 [Solanum verrucosum]